MTSLFVVLLLNLLIARLADAAFAVAAHPTRSAVVPQPQFPSFHWSDASDAPRHSTRRRERGAAVRRREVRIRGGGSGLSATTAAASLALPTRLALQGWSGLCIAQGFLLTVLPKRTAPLLLGVTEPNENDDDDPDDAIVTCSQGIGCVLLGNGVTMLLAATDWASTTTTTIQQAIGIGLLFRLLNLYWAFACGRFGFLAERFLSTNTVIMTGATLSMITGLGRPATAAKVFSSLAIFKAGLLFLRPAIAAQQFLHKDNIAAAQGMYKSLGMHLLCNALFMATLAFGMDPIRATLCSAWTWFAFMAEELLGVSTSGRMFQVQAVRLAIMGVTALFLSI